MAADKMLALEHVDAEIAVVKNLCATPLDVALNPELSLDQAYYTINRKGSDHIFTCTKKDGSTWSFEWGSSTTLISESTRKLKERVLDFLRANKIFMDLESAPISYHLTSAYGRIHCRVKDVFGNCDSFILPKHIVNESDASKYVVSNYGNLRQI